MISAETFEAYELQTLTKGINDWFKIWSNDIILVGGPNYSTVVVSEQNSNKLIAKYSVIIFYKFRYEQL